MSGFLCLAAVVRAQTAPAAAPQVIDEGLRRQAERAQRTEAPAQPSALRPAPARDAVPPLPIEVPCFPILEIEIAGAAASRLAWLKSATAPFLHRCIGPQGIARIAGYLDAQLIEWGYVTSRVLVGEQNLASGRLTLQLHAGRISQVQMLNADADDRPVDDRWGTWRNALATRPGDLLNARDLEQAVEQMKRLPSQSVTTTLSPGEDPDTSVVTIERRVGGWPDRIRGGVTLDNSGSAAMGRMQASVSLALDNPLGLNDILALNANSNIEQVSPSRRSQGLTLNYSVPAGYTTITATAIRSRFAQSVQLPTVKHLSTGESSSAELQIDHVLLRTASTRLGGYSGISTRKSRSFLDETELLNQRRQTTFFEAGLSVKKLFDHYASLEASLGYRRGVSWLYAQKDLQKDPFDPSSTPTLRPRIWIYGATLLVPFQQPAQAGSPGRTWEYSARLRGQRSNDHSLSIDQFAIGNRSSVRGFDGDSVLIAESGWTLRNEISTALPLGDAEGVVYVGLDLGRVWGVSDALLIGRGLAGAALGWRGRIHGLQFDLAAAEPLIKPDGFKTARTSVYASVTLGF